MRFVDDVFGTSWSPMMNRQLPPFQKEIRHRLDSLMATHRVALLGHAENLVPPDDPATIVASIPAVRVRNGSDIYTGRRQRLRLVNGSAEATILARTRSLPATVVDSRCVVQCATNRFGRAVPVSCLDLRTQTLDLLVDLNGATVVKAAPDTDPARLIVEQIYGTPLATLMRDPTPPRVGPSVHRRVRTVLEQIHTQGRERIQQELGALEGAALADSLPTALIRRMANLRTWLGRTEAPESTGKLDGPEESAPVTSAQVDLEVSRLVRLVTSRACGAIRIAETAITCLVNARMVGRRAARPVLFRLDLQRPVTRATVLFWNPLRPTRQGAAPCLGRGEYYLHQIRESRDLYGMVDLVLNYLETNQIGMVSRIRHRTTRDWLATLADLL